MPLFFPQFHLYGLIIGLGVLAAYHLTQKRLRCLKIGSSLDQLFLFLLPSSLIGARLYHVLDHWQYYSRDLLQIFSLASGGLAIYGAIIGGIIGLILFLYLKKQLSYLLLYFDLLAPGVLLAQAIGRWGNYVNQEAFGPPTTFPWGVYISLKNRPIQYQNSAFFQPLFLYESLWDLLGVYLILKFFSKPRSHGLTFGFYLLWYGLGRFYLETFRFDTAVFSGFKVAQVLSFFAVAIGLVFVFKRLFQKGNATITPR